MRVLEGASRRHCASFDRGCFRPRLCGNSVIRLFPHPRRYKIAKHPFMGARMLRDQLHRQGVHVGRRHISTLMQRWIGSRPTKPT